MPRWVYNPHTGGKSIPPGIRKSKCPPRGDWPQPVPDPYSTGRSVNGMRPGKIC